MSEANKDEALKCSHLSKRFFEQDEYELAIKYAEKSVKLHPSAEAATWLEKVKQISVESRSQPKHEIPAATKDCEAKGKNMPATHSAMYTKEQEEEVRGLLKVNKEDFYAVLGVSKEATEIEIKRSYKKLALQFHPDKNRAPGADEAFKIVSRAFSCLSDANKKLTYDRFGAESASPGLNYRGPFGGATRTNFEGDISPEELFNMFFGNFNDANGGINFQFGGPGGAAAAFAPFFMQAFADANGGGPRFMRRNGAHTPRKRTEAAGWISLLVQIIPLMFMALLILVNNFFGRWEASDSRSWSAISHHVSLRGDNNTYPHPFTTRNLGIPYYGTPSFRDYFTDRSYRERELRIFEDTIEREYIKVTQKECREEEVALQRQRSQAIASGDTDELERLGSVKCLSCEKLHSLKLPLQ